MELGKRKEKRQDEFWAATRDIVRPDGHPFYQRLGNVHAKGAVERADAQVKGDHRNGPNWVGCPFFGELLKEGEEVLAVEQHERIRGKALLRKRGELLDRPESSCVGDGWYAARVFAWTGKYLEAVADSHGGIEFGFVDAEGFRGGHAEGPARAPACALHADRCGGSCFAVFGALARLGGSGGGLAPHRDHCAPRADFFARAWPHADKCPTRPLAA